ncbi:hypothetical protein ABZ726_31035, partial [Streptomyces hundungensis]
MSKPQHPGDAHGGGSRLKPGGSVPAQTAASGATPADGPGPATGADRATGAGLGSGADVVTGGALASGADVVTGGDLAEGAGAVGRLADSVRRLQDQLQRAQA